jgi:hypothetical protein
MDLQSLTSVCLPDGEFERLKKDMRLDISTGGISSFFDRYIMLDSASLSDKFCRIGKMKGKLERWLQ